MILERERMVDHTERFRAGERVRERSKLLFGNRDTLDVAVAVARDETGAVSAAEIADAISLAPNRVRAQLIAFVELGFMAEAPPMRWERRRWFMRVDDPFWAFCADLHDRWNS